MLAPPLSGVAVVWPPPWSAARLEYAKGIPSGRAPPAHGHAVQRRGAGEESHGARHARAPTKCPPGGHPVHLACAQRVRPRGAPLPQADARAPRHEEARCANTAKARGMEGGRRRRAWMSMRWRSGASGSSAAGRCGSRLRWGSAAGRFVKGFCTKPTRQHVTAWNIRFADDGRSAKRPFHDRHAS